MANREDAEMKTCFYAGLTADGKQKRIEIEGSMKVWPAKAKIKLPVGTAFLMPVAKTEGGGLTAWLGEIEILDEMDIRAGDIVCEDREEYKDWIVTNTAGQKARTMTAALNKARKEKDEGIFDLTINQIHHRMYNMNRSQKAAVCAYVLQRLGGF